MYMGSGLFALLVLECVLIYFSVIKQQTLAPWILLLGGIIMALLYLSLYFEITFPYETLKLNGYLVFFFAALLILAGMIGISVRFFRYILKKVEQTSRP